MKKEFEMIGFSIKPEKEGQYIVINEDGSYEVLSFITLYNELDWRDLFDNKVIFKPKYWLKEIKSNE